MDLKLNKNLSLPWTPQGEKASGNHQILLPREKATCTSLIFPICFKFTRVPPLHDPTFWLSCNNSLTSPTVLLWPIHHHSHKYLYQLSSACEQKPIFKKTTYLRKKNMWNQNGRLYDQSLIWWCARQTRTQALHFSGKMYTFLISPHQNLKTSEHTWTKTILSGGVRSKTV